MMFLTVDIELGTDNAEVNDGCIEGKGGEECLYPGLAPRLLLTNRCWTLSTVHSVHPSLFWFYFWSRLKRWELVIHR